MIINWLGQSCMRIQSGGLSFVIDPFSPETGLRLPRIKADVLLITHNHSDHNYKEGVSGDYFLIERPGEYEVKGVQIRGIESFHDENSGKERGLNTIFRIELENSTIVHLGDFGQKELTPEQKEKIDGVDVLFIPVGGVYTIDAKCAWVITRGLEPKVIFPIHYRLPGLKYKLDSVDEFLAAAKVKGVTQDKFSFRKNEIADFKQKVVILKSGL